MNTQLLLVVQIQRDRGLAACNDLCEVEGSPRCDNSNGEKGGREGGEMGPIGQKGDKGKWG